MKRFLENGLVYYRFELFDPFPQVAHGVFTRHGGVSPPPCQGLNVAFVPEDAEANVRANLDLAAEALGLSGLAFADQVHGDKSLVVRAGDAYRPRTRKDVLDGYDALITPDPGPGLMVKLADCQGVLLFDPRTGVLALVHSGWRGSALNVIGKTAARLKNEFGVRPEDLLAGVSPSLGPCCAEFVNYRDELPPKLWDYQVSDRRFDLWAVSQDQLAAAGVRPENVEVARICTKCGGDDFYSYRREKVTGRFGLIAGVRE